MAVIFVTVSGHKRDQFIQETYANKTYANKIYSRVIVGRMTSAIQVTTAASMCAVLDLLATGKIAARGFVRQEDIGLDVFLQNRFGSHYLPAPGNGSRTGYGLAVA